MTKSVDSGKDATLVELVGSIPEKIIRYLTLIFPETKQAVLIAQSINEQRASVRKALRRLFEQGQLETPSKGKYRLSNDFLQLSGKTAPSCGMEVKKIPNFLRKQLPPELHFLQLGYPVESHGFHFSAYPVEGNYKRIYFEEKFKSGRVKFDCYPDHVEIKFGCSDDPLDAIELCYLYDFILEKLTQLSGKDNHNVICKQHDLHQDRHDFSYKGKRITLEVLQQTLSLAAYEKSRRNHPLVQQENFLRNESRSSFPARIPDITFAMARVSAGVLTDLSQKNLNTTMDATLRQINYERFTYLSDLKESAEGIAAAASRIDINSEEQTAATFRIEDEQREIKDIAASIDGWAGAIAENTHRLVDATLETKEQLIEDHDNLELQLIHQKSEFEILNTKIDLLIDDNTYEHEEVFTRLQYQEGLLNEILQKEIPELGLHLLEFLAESPGGLTFDEILSKFRRNNIPLSRGRISQLASELKKHIHRDKIYTGKRGRPKHKLKLKEDDEN
ncbi:MAG: hypothetical protein KAU62_04075 [Candidatus Heimdallarchaeota archaeon]|nr:hypothetical protein [Candidatus Heimdallarchaeota archaeon]MCK4610314.1 hypothetical protein [Candidatus Heimdallarchaeota archaeon]